MVKPVETVIEQQRDPARGVGDRAALRPALERLDRRLERAVAVAQGVYGPDSAGDPFRGLYINADEVERLLAQPPGTPTLAGDPFAPEDDDPAEESAAFRWLRETYDLTRFDLDLVLIALAPEIDLRYERLYAFLQNDVTRRRPSVDLALNLLCATTETKLARRAHFAADAPLLRRHLLHLLPDPNHTHPPLLAHTLKLDPQVVEWLLGQESLDSRLVPLCRWVAPAGSLSELPLPAGMRDGLEGLVLQARVTRRPLRLYFQAVPGSGTTAIAAAVAEAAGMPLLAVRGAALATAEDATAIPPLLVRAARFDRAALYIEGLDALRGPDQQPIYEALLAALDDHPGLVILTGEEAWLDERAAAGDGGDEVITVPFPLPDAPHRGEYWRAALAAAGYVLPDPDLETLAARFRLTPGQIAAAVATAQSQGRWLAALAGDPPDPLGRAIPLTTADLFAAARAQSGHDLAALARKIRPGSTWADLVLPADALAQLREICQRVGLRRPGARRLGLRPAAGLGKGLTALFAGPSGTGKTMAAEVIARELGLDLYKIDLSGVVSKYIGETEKNLDRIFSAAERRQRDPVLRRGRRAVRQALRGARLARPLRQHRDLLPAAEDGAVRGRRDPGHQPARQPGRGVRAPAGLHHPLPVPRRGPPPPDLGGHLAAGIAAGRRRRPRLPGRASSG